MVIIYWWWPVRLRFLILLELVVVLLLAFLARNEFSYGKVVSIFLCCGIGFLIYYQAHSISESGYSYHIAFCYKLIGAVLVAFYLSVEIDL